MKLSVIGAGYVGLTTAAGFAQIGHEVFCSESDPDKLAKLQNGGMPLFEPHLENVIKSVRRAGRLRFGSTEDAIAWGDAIFICVGTPPLANGDADLSAIEGVARAIAKRAPGYRLVVEKSTVPVQTGAQLLKHLSVHGTNRLKYDVASNPEFLREGTSVEDFLHPDRIVIGADSPRAADLLREIYEPILKQKFTCPIHSICPKRNDPIFLATDTNSAELIKHASNSFLAMKISFINMVANLCEVVGADVTKVAQGMGLDPRIGSSFLNPGIGFGGFCFPKDVQAFIRIAEKSGCDFSLLKEVEKINQRRVEHFVEKIRTELWVMRGKKLAVWGLAFKPNTDDVRFAPSLALVKALLDEGAIVSAYDPEAMEKAKTVLPEVNYCAEPYAAAQGAEAVLLVTEWDEFRQIDWDRLSTVVERQLIVDCRNMLDASEAASHGFHYFSVGRPPVLPVQTEPIPIGASSLARTESAVENYRRR
ncbi:MAG TPA: UDP-glucose/GDP-mannose dehydrogenase family protein [Terriglobales bacterium]|jgi:UDPglucose 6-dehydrogenase|nr:UDP-glucose/GDP-mannose dehydrogenase family protein [Terriglobales bacterium]